MMTKMIHEKEKNWDLELNRVLWAYRIAVKPSMQFSPCQLVYGKQAMLPLDVEIPALKLLIETGQEPMDNYKSRLNALQIVQLDRELAFHHYESMQLKRHRKSKSER